MTIYNYLVVAPEKPWKTFRGYDRTILDKGFKEFYQRHLERKAEYPTLGLMLGHPGGKDLDVVAWRDGFTGMRSDQMLRTARDIRGETIVRTIAEVCEKGTILYVGGNPGNVTVMGAGLYPYVRMGFGLAFDALSSFSSPCTLTRSALDFYQSGIRCWTESNDSRRVTGDMPVVAAPKPWRNADKVGPNRTRIEDAPPGSIWWWRAVALDNPWSDNVADARRAVKAGLHLCVRLEQLTAVERNDLYRMIGG